MPVFQVAVGDSTYRVEVQDPHADPMQIVVDGQEFLVSIARGEGAAGEGPARAAPSAPPAAATFKPPAESSRPSPCFAPDPGSKSIVAPMPGIVLRIPVRVGQKVARGDVLCVLEAMKMKNPIPANQEGRVAEIAVKPGQAVAFGDLLVRLA